ncbi:hypothetical protein Tco_0693334 [Tanacetum coccineum]
MTNSLLDAGVNLQSGKVLVVGTKQKVRRRIRQEVRGGGGRRTLAVFRPLLNIKVEFWEGELETAFVLPNSALFEIHMPWLKIHDKVYMSSRVSIHTSLHKEGMPNALDMSSDVKDRVLLSV